MLKNPSLKNRTGKKMNTKRPKKEKVESTARLLVERVQTGVRIEKRLLKVLKGLAEYHDMNLGDLLEGIVLHVFEGKLPFKDESLRRIAQLRDIYSLDLTAEASHHLYESEKSSPEKNNN